jgi:hypothetical protein
MSRGASEGASVRIFLLHGRNRLTSHIILLFGRVRELQGDGTWLIDDEGRPVLWLDSRAARLVKEVRASPQNAALYRRTGSGLNACQQGPQPAWLQANAPECVSRAATAFHCKD